MKFNLVSYAFLGENKTFTNVRKFAGGEEIYLYDLARLLKNAGNEVTVIQAGEKDSNFMYSGINVRTFGPVNKRLFNLYWKKKIDKDADRVHLHDFEYAFPRANNKITGTCHGVTWDIPSKTSPYWKFHNFYHKFLAKKAIKVLNKVASVDSFLLRFAKDETPKYTNKIKIINSYVKTGLFNSKIDGKTVRKKFGDRDIILFPRNLTFVRGSLLILDAMKNVVNKNPDALLVMTGTGPLKSRIEFLIGRYRLKDNVVLIGHQNHLKDMPKLYAASDLVVIPSLGREGCSLSCLESMATRKPVIATDVGGLPDIIKNNHNGLLVRPESKDIANAIIFMLNDKKERDKFARNGYNTIKKRFTYKIWSEKYLEFFNLT